MSEAATAEKTTVKTVDDLIVNVIHEVENYSKEQAYDIASKLEEDVEFSYFRLGGILNRINEEGWYADEGFQKFTDFVEDRFGVKRSKAMHLIKIYNDLIASGVTWDVVSSIGWSKLKEISGVITKKNAKGWVKKANEMSVIQLAEYVRQQKAKDVSGGTDDADAGEAPQVSSMTFKMHNDQKEVVQQAVEKAKEETGTDHANVALEAICLDYLSGPSKPKMEESALDIDSEDEGGYTLEGLKEYMAQFEYMQVLEVFETIWPTVDITVHEP